MKKTVKIILIILVVVLIGTYIFVQKTKPLELDVYSLERGDMVRDFKETASLESENIETISPKFMGEILFIADKGSMLKAGETLFKIDDKELLKQKEELLAKNKSIQGQEEMSSPTLYSSQISAADLAIENAGANLKRAEADEKKFRELYEAGITSKSEYEMYKRAYDDATTMLALRQNERQVIIDSSSGRAGTDEFFGGQIEGISLNIKDIENRLKQAELKADTDLIVTEVFSKKGATGNPSMPIMEIASMDGLYAKASVLSSDAMALKIGDEVKVIEKIGDESFEKYGKIVSIAKYASTQISSLGLKEQRVEVKIKSDSFKDLILGADMDIVFETMHLTDVLTVPKTAVFKEEGKNFIWEVKDNILKKTELELGKDTDYDYEVLAGLDDGARVVMDANNKDLEEGKKVK